MAITLIVLLIALCMMITEFLVPGRKWRKVEAWWRRALLLNGFQVGSVFVAGIAWDKWFLGASLWQGEEVLGITGGAITGYLVITFIYYWWHRARHQSRFLWNWFHQVHHSPERLEVITSFYKHPIEIFFNSALSSLILYSLVGLGPASASIAVLLTGIAELFYHWNVKTPYWIGFIFQRPESHCIHHKRGWHKQNFSDLPLWDLLFGTFHNPRVFEGTCGFRNDREQQLFAMLGGKDVNQTAGK